MCNTKRIKKVGFIPVVFMIVAALSFALFGCGSSGEGGSHGAASDANSSGKIKESVDKYSWEELSTISEEIAAADSEDAAVEIAKQYNLTTPDGKLDGTQIKTVELPNDQLARVQIAGFWHDEKASGGKAGITFIFMDAIADRPMNAAGGNAGGWEKAELRSWLASEGMSMLPSELSDKIVEVRKLSDNIGQTTSVDSVTPTSDKLWLFSPVELGGEQTSAKPGNSVSDSISAIRNAQGTQYKLFRDQDVNPNGARDDILEKSYMGKEKNFDWWERSAWPDRDLQFYAVTGGFFSGYGRLANEKILVVPGFCI